MTDEREKRDKGFFEAGWRQAFETFKRKEAELRLAKMALERIAKVCERDDDLSGEEVLGEIAEICERALKGTS